MTDTSPDGSEQDEERQMMRLRLYIAGHSGPSAVEIEIVDVLEHPDRAEDRVSGSVDPHDRGGRVP